MEQRRPGELNLELVNLNKAPMRQGQRIRRQTERRQTEHRQTNHRRINHEQIRRRQTKHRKRFLRNLASTVIAVNAGIIVLYLFFFYSKGDTEAGSINRQADFNIINNYANNMQNHPEWTEDFLTVNEYSRPGTAIGKVKDIFVHYTANPGTSAAQNRSYFEQLKDTKERSASSHFIIGLEGEILLCVPLEEVAYAVIGRNEDSISIECCYANEDGSFTEETYQSLVKLLSWLTETYGLDTQNILRHYDCGGKKCPLYYVEHEEQWKQLKQDVKDIKE